MKKAIVAVAAGVLSVGVIITGIIAYRRNRV